MPTHLPPLLDDHFYQPIPGVVVRVVYHERGRCLTADVRLSRPQDADPPGYYRPDIDHPAVVTVLLDPRDPTPPRNWIGRRVKVRLAVGHDIRAGEIDGTYALCD